MLGARLTETALATIVHTNHFSKSVRHRERRLPASRCALGLQAGGSRSHQKMTRRTAMVWRNPRLSSAALVAMVWGAVLSVAPILHAQVVTGTLLGTVTDPSGQVVPNVEVVATLVDRGLQRTTTTNDAGAYELGFLAVGTYRIVAIATGFKAQVQENVELRLDQRLRIDFTLQLGALTEE